MLGYSQSTLSSAGLLRYGKFYPFPKAVMRDPAPAKPTTNPALADKTEKFQHQPKSVGSLQFSSWIKIQLHLYWPWSSMALFLMASLRWFYATWKKDWRYLPPSLLRIPPLKLLNKAKCHHRLSALITLCRRLFPSLSPVPDVLTSPLESPTQEPPVPESERWFHPAAKSKPAFLDPSKSGSKSPLPQPPPTRGGRKATRYAWNLKLFSIWKKSQ